jgi:hypothetical protein
VRDHQQVCVWKDRSHDPSRLPLLLAGARTGRPGLPLLLEPLHQCASGFELLLEPFRSVKGASGGASRTWTPSPARSRFPTSAVPRASAARPHRGFASDIRQMRARTSEATAGRPGPHRRLFQVQYRVKPARCQRRDRLGLDDGDDLRPAAPQAGEQDPEQAVGGAQAWARRGALEDGQLMPQRDVLEHQGAVGPDPTEEAGEDEGEHGGHHPAGRAEVQS